MSNLATRGPVLVVAAPKAIHKTKPKSVPVPGIARDIQVKIASEFEEWEQAFELVASNYRAKGYEAESAKPFRFTPYHALPDTITPVAIHEGKVVATLTFVADNTILGLPMESIYGSEIEVLRGAGRRLGETTSLADSGLSTREFLQVFVTLIQVVMQHHTAQGGDTWVITVNPRHRNFYTKVLGFKPLGPCREYPSVQGNPAEAYILDLDLMRANAPKMYQHIYGVDLPEETLANPRMSPNLVRFFGSKSSQTDYESIDEILHLSEILGSPRRW